MKAGDLGIDPNRIGMLGFSAGGHLTARTATNGDRRSYDPINEAEKASCRPDFAVLVNPAYLTPKGKPDELSPEIRVSVESPPSFFAHAYNDHIPAENSIRMFLELMKNNVPAELHVFGTGGHGFGLRPSDDARSTRPARCEAWMKSRELLAKEK